MYGAISEEDRERAKLTRKNAVSPLDYDKGMESDFDFDAFQAETNANNSLGSGGSANLGGVPFSDIGGTPPNGLNTSGGWGTQGLGDVGGLGGLGGLGGMNGVPPQPQKKSVDTIIEESVMSFGGKFKEFMSEFIRSFKTFDLDKRLLFGKRVTICSLIGFLSALVASIITRGFFMPIAIASLFSLGVGIPIFMFSMDKANKRGDFEPVDMVEEPLPSFGDTGFSDTVDADDFGDVCFADEDEDDWDENLFEDSPEGDEGVFTESATKSTITEEELLARVPDNCIGMTRQFLYENLVSLLDNCTPDYSNVREIEEDSEEFDDWSAILNLAAEALMTSDQPKTMPYLEKAKETLFYYSLEVEHVGWMKVDALVNEMVNIYGYDESEGKINKEVAGSGFNVGRTWMIRIMKGTTARVTLKDAMRDVSKDFLNPDNYMPVAMGVSETGKIIFTDLKHMESLLVSGAPRSGKSWTVLNILFQMMAFLPPSRLNLHILDAKGNMSDFKSFVTPHVKKFVTSDLEIVDALRNICKVEGERRDAIIGGANFVNIWDYNKANPDCALPLIYVVIDEVVALAERMSKDVKTEFQSLLTEMVTRMPAYGIRIFMIPHVIKNDVIKKTTTQNILCRMSVRGDAEHIENSTGARPKDFPTRLTHVGDIALKLNNDEVCFMHSIILATENERNQELVSILGKFWAKVEPNSVADSVMYGKNRQDLLNTLAQDALKGKGDDTVMQLQESNSPRGYTEDEDLFEDAEEVESNRPDVSDTDILGDEEDEYGW